MKPVNNEIFQKEESNNEKEKDEYLPLTDRSFQILIHQYEEEAKAARVMAERGVGNHMSAAAQCMEDLALDAKQLHRKFLQSCVNNNEKKIMNSIWTSEDIKTLQLLGFDISGILINKENIIENNSINNTKKFNHILPNELSNIDTLLAAEQRIQVVQIKADNLAKENNILRQALARYKSKISKKEINIKSSSLLLLETNSIDKTQKNPLIALTHAIEELKEAFLHQRNRFSIIQEMREKFTLALNDIRIDQSKLYNNTKEENTNNEIPYSIIEDAFRILRNIYSCNHVHYTLGEGNEMSLIDKAVIQLLNDLNLPFPVQIHRLGPGGHYFIDQHVEIKLTENFQLLVRPWLNSDSLINGINDKNRPRYEHLAKYIIHLYSPAMNLDKVDEYDNNVIESKFSYNITNNNNKKTNNSQITSDQISNLRHKQRELRQTLEDRYKELQQHQKILEAGLSSSPNRYNFNDNNESINLREKSLVNSNNNNSDKCYENCTRKEDKTIIELKNNSSEINNKVTHILHLLETNGSVPDLSNLSETELRRLKRTALRRQIRAFKGLSGVISPNLSTEYS